ncbi:unnamed protein product [marine sediment metagenome]|uniref:Uncharacterized protein n=1 Tax=marine sediment metagenome TaxID=412755 RepID=X1HGL1_9ZZZZ
MERFITTNFKKRKKRIEKKMREIDGWHTTRVNTEIVSEGKCKDRVLSREEVAEELGEGYDCKT